MRARNPSSFLFALLLAASVAASTAHARQADPEEESAPSFATVAGGLRAEAKSAFSQERWSDAVEAYGRLVGHLLEGGYAEESAAVAYNRFMIAVAFKNSGDLPAARTMLLYLAESAPEYEAVKRGAVLNEVRAALGLPRLPLSPPPPETPRAAGPIRMGSDVRRPEKLHGYTAEYTSMARRARIQGVVIVEVVIDTLGNVTNVRVLKPLPMGLDAAAVAAVKRWKFRPATRNGKPVAVYYNLTVNFRLP